MHDIVFTCRVSIRGMEYSVFLTPSPHARTHVHRYELHRFSNDSVLAVSDYVDGESAVELMLQRGSDYQVCTSLGWLDRFSGQVKGTDRPTSNMIAHALYAYVA